MINKIKNKLSNEKGFTLIELLVVISIIAILFVTLLPQIDFAGDRARQAGVKTDFHTFQIAAESYLRETAGGKGSDAGVLSGTELNSYLDLNMQVTTGAAEQPSAKKDPWGEEYVVQIFNANQMIAVYSFGKNEGTVATAPFKMATYYKQGLTGTCTLGFDNNNLVANSTLLATPATCATGTGAAAIN